jgi:hypothetical protein
MKFPYGISDFNAVMTEGYFYCDRTTRIPMLENAGKYLLFIRPRRFGKTPTPLRSRYLMLQWDFSCVDPTGTAADIRRALFNHINTCIRTFLMKYNRFGLEKMVKIHEDGQVSLRSLAAAVRRQTIWKTILFRSSGAPQMILWRKWQPTSP